MLVTITDNAGRVSEYKIERYSYISANPLMNEPPRLRLHKPEPTIDQEFLKTLYLGNFNVKVDNYNVQCVPGLFINDMTQPDAPYLDVVLIQY